MPDMPSRRRFVATASAAGAAAMIGSTRAPADEGPPETTTVRLCLNTSPPMLVNGESDVVDCDAPMSLAQELLSALFGHPRLIAGSAAVLCFVAFHFGTVTMTEPSTGDLFGTVALIASAHFPGMDGRVSIA